jgi:hypothetical protein
MMMKKVIIDATASLAILLCACGSTPKTHYYLIGATENVDTTVASTYSVGIGPIQMAEYLQRPQLITVEDNNILYSDFHRWGEPLKTAVTRVVTLNLVALLKNSNIVLFPWRSDEIPEMRVRITVIDFNRIGDQALLTVNWEVDLSTDPTREIQNLETFEVAVKEDGYEDLAKAYSELLGKLSAVLAENITRLRSEATPE